MAGGLMPDPREPLAASSCEQALRDLVEALDSDETRGTLNYYIGPGARVLHTPTVWNRIYAAVDRAKEALADADA